MGIDNIAGIFEQLAIQISALRNRIIGIGLGGLPSQRFFVISEQLRHLRLALNHRKKIIADDRVAFIGDFGMSVHPDM